MTDVDVEHGDRWEFNEAVADVFDDMLERSIPQYHKMRSAVFEISRRFLRAEEVVVDLGCSRGEALAPLVQLAGDLDERYQPETFFGIEISKPMLTAARDRFAGRDDVAIVERDLRRSDSIPPGPISLALSILTLQFVPIEYRPSVLARVYEETARGGALVVVEKILGDSARTQEMFSAIYLDSKYAAGYSREEIERKRLALEGVLVPLSAGENERMLRSAGYRSVECFWRWLNFAGWIAIA